MLRTIFARSSPASHPAAAAELLAADLFIKTLALECKRTERSGRGFILMVLDAERLLQPAQKKHALPKLLSVLQAVRDTDIKGWFKDGAALGVIFTEVGEAADKEAVRILATRVTNALYAAFTVEEINELRLSFHVFPEDWDNEDRHSGPKKSTLRVALTEGKVRSKLEIHLKRVVDVVGSVGALIFFLPLMLLIALAVKMTSRGPVLFRQSRIGQHGKKFMFLKFRSMHVDTDASIHETYVKAFIAGQAEAHSNGKQTKVFKMTADPRVTPLGRWLRKTSLDELPQFFNVLKGEMSLVGPRPPLRYEVNRYSLWHRRRLLAVKPGITGLWQVEGRSRVTFDEMVRLDIRYARTWSFWVDVKILAQTPQAVISGSGAC